jgi:phage terminase small subunit
MKINRKNILASFVDYDQRTQDMLDNIITQLIKQDKECNDYTLVIIQMLAVQFEIYFKALDALKDGIVNVVSLGDRTLHQPKPQLDALQKANNQINKMLKDLALTPLDRAKIKKLNKNDEDDAQQLLEALID